MLTVGRSFSGVPKTLNGGRTSKGFPSSSFVLGVVDPDFGILSFVRRELYVAESARRVSISVEPCQ